MTKSYRELQEDAARAFSSYQKQRIRATEIMDAVRNTCIEELGIPAENLLFHETKNPGEDEPGRPSARRAIDRDENGGWNACLSVRVVPSTGNGYLLTHLYLEIQFEGDNAYLALTGQGGLRVEFADLREAGKAALPRFLDAISLKLEETNDWLRTGAGEKPTIGFGQ